MGTSASLKTIPNELVVPANPKGYLLLQPPPKPLDDCVVLVELLTASKWDVLSYEPWMTVDKVEKTSPLGFVSLTIQLNEKESRSGFLKIQDTESGYVAETEIRQAAGISIVEQTQELMNSPMSMEPSVAVKFLTKEITQAPPPAQAALLEVLIDLINTTSEELIAARSLIQSAPEPLPLFPGLAPGVPLTAQYIEKQSVLLQAYAPMALASQE